MLWALQLPPCSFHHAGVTAVKARERKEREEGNRRENKGKKLRLQMYTSAFWLIQGMAHPYGSLFIANIPYKLETFFYHHHPLFFQTSDVPEECLNYYGIPEEFAASLFNLFHASCCFFKAVPSLLFPKGKPRAPCSSSGTEFTITLFLKSLWVYSMAIIIYLMLKFAITCSDFWAFV